MRKLQRCRAFRGRRMDDCVELIEQSQGRGRRPRIRRRQSVNDGFRHGFCHVTEIEGRGEYCLDFGNRRDVSKRDYFGPKDREYCLGRSRGRGFRGRPNSSRRNHRENEERGKYCFGFSQEDIESRNSYRETKGE